MPFVQDLTSQGFEHNRLKPAELADFEHIQEEIADVEIMMAQMRLIFDHDGRVDDFIKKKTRRLKERIEANSADM